MGVTLLSSASLAMMEPPGWKESNFGPRKLRNEPFGLPRVEVPLPS